MEEKIGKISLPCDSDGYTLFQCPYCNNYFKLNNNELIEEEINDLFCPICGLSSSLEKFITDDVKQYAQDIAFNYAIEMLNKRLKKLERSSKGMLKLTKPLKTKPEKRLYDREEGFEIVHFECCNKSAKIFLLDKETAYCPYCGVN